MAECSPSLSLSPLSGKPITVATDGGDLTSDAGVLLLRELDREIGLVSRLAACLDDPRQPGKVQHSLEALLTQRLFQIAAGYEDCNDAHALRRDPAFRLALEKHRSDPPLASQSTLSRLENRITWRECYRLSLAFVEAFVARHREHPPRRVVLDFDTTDDPTHGQQQFSFYNAFYGCHCYLPLVIFAQCGPEAEQELLGALLLPGNAHGGNWAPTLLRLLVLRLRAAFPKCRLEFRADSGFGSPQMYDTCEGLEVPYVISLPQNSKLLTLAAPFLEQAHRLYQERGRTVQVFGKVRYRAGTWSQVRRVIVKAEWMAEGANPRFVVTSRRTRHPKPLYRFYCQRGDAENRIKELKEGLRVDRLSCHSFRANQFRLLLFAAAYLLCQALRTRLAGTPLASAQVSTLRLRLLKVGALLKESTRRLHVSLPSGYAWFGCWHALLEGAPG